MPRKLRLEYAGAIYHVMNRGDRREAIFLDDKDREEFLRTLGETCAKTGWQVHALCRSRTDPSKAATSTPALINYRKRRELWFRRVREGDEGRRRGSHLVCNRPQASIVSGLLPSQS